LHPFAVLCETALPGLDRDLARIEIAPQRFQFGAGGGELAALFRRLYVPYLRSFLAFRDRRLAPRKGRFGSIERDRPFRHRCRFCLPYLNLALALVEIGEAGGECCCASASLSNIALLHRDRRRCASAPPYRPCRQTARAAG